MLGIYKRQGNYEDVRKLVLVNTITFFAITILSIIGIISYLRGYTLVGLFDLAAATLLCMCILNLRRTGKYHLPVYTGMSIMTLLYYYLFFTGGARNTGFLWYYTYPLFTLYIMGKREGAIAIGILFIPTFTYLLTIWPADDPQYSQDFTIRFIPSVFCVFLFSYLFEDTRFKTHAKLQSKQIELEASIKSLRSKETELKKAHDGLEVEIEERTRELQDSYQLLKFEIEERKRSEGERKKLEAQLMRAQKMEAIGTLAGGVAHDLNNILSGITSYPELLMMSLPEDSPLQEPLRTIRSSGEKAVTIVQDLLTLSRRGTAAFSIVDLTKVASDYLESLEFEKMISFHRGIAIKRCFTALHTNISGSAVHLSKTLMNLITNAAEAMPEGGTIDIAIENLTISESNQSSIALIQGEYVKLSISDTGTGIPSEIIDRIFEPFFTTKKMGRSGTGLGMAVVWGTIQDHKGHIEVRSTPGIGTTFELFFPSVRADLVDKKIVEEELPGGNNETILVVDDVAGQREIAADILQTLGYAVKSVSSGEAAIAHLQKEHADLVLLDMTMDPGINGLETFRRILQFKPNQKVIINSGFSESVLVKKALKLGVRSYVKKPYTVKSISKAVKEALSTET